MNIMAVAPTIIDVFKDVYRQLDKDSVKGDLLGRLYSDDVLFQDPLHRIKGLSNYRQYCAELYENVIEIAFDFDDVLVSDGQALVTWEMRYRHSKMNGGKEIKVPGASHIKYDEKVYYHRDYYDGGALLYEHVPVLGAAIRFLKKRVEV